MFALDRDNETTGFNQERSESLVSLSLSQTPIGLLLSIVLSCDTLRARKITIDNARLLSFIIETMLDCSCRVLGTEGKPKEQDSPGLDYKGKASPSLYCLCLCLASRKDNAH